MAINYATSINTGLFASAVATDAAYQVGGTYIPASLIRLGGIALSGVLVAPGTGVAPADTITMTGGTFSSASVFTVTNTKLVGTTVNAAGTVYAPLDLITLTAVGGTMGTAAILQVTHTKLVSATVAAGGTGYGNATTFNVTVATGSGTAVTDAVVNVTTNSSGVVTTINSVTNAGDYTKNPSNIATNPVTGNDGVDLGTGLTLALVFGVKNALVATAGVFTGNATSFTQASTTGSGTGATFNAPAFGANVIALTTAGSYTVLPTEPVLEGSSSGSGTGVSIQVTWSEGSAHEENILCLVELLRSYATTIATIDEAKLVSEMLRHAAAELASGSGLSTMPARLQSSVMKVYSDPRRSTF
jgi:hypothetical protein